MAKWIVLALIALSALPDAYTDGPGKCSQVCGQGPSHDFKFNLQRGHTYVYNFEASTETSVPGAAAKSEDENTHGDKKPGGERLHITGQAELSAGPECHHTMRLLHVQVTGADGKKFQDFQSCEKHPVGFSWNNGVLGDELCVEPDDNPSNVNVKRAILSLVQVSRIQSSGSAHAHETDIFGTCPTDYSFYEDGATLKVTKRRNLNRCAHREGLHNTFLTSSYSGPSHFHSTPLMDSTLQVEQTIKDHVLVSAVGHEDYLFRPFSNGAAGARTTVTTKLTLVQHQPSSVPSVTNGAPSSVLFDSHNWNYGGANPEEEVSVEILTTALKNAEQASHHGVSIESAGLFRRVIRVMRYASTKTLLDVYSQVKAGAGFGNAKIAKNIFVDALLQVGTGQSVEAAVQLINSKDVPQAVAKLYYIGLSFVRHATRGSMKAAATLLESPSTPPEALLGVGSLVGRYCSEHLCDDSIPEYKLLVGKLASKLGGGCKPVSKEHENEIVGALKGLQNAHKLTAEAAEAVAKCAASNDVLTRIRVAALDAVRGDPCNMKMKKRAMEMMKNRDLDSELRIKAYLAVVQCPCDKVAVAVKEMMESEPINQVGSFVSSHLLSLRTSSNPENAKAKHLLAGIRPKKRYPQDIRKFSRAFEVSYALDDLNMGSSAEGNVIFSQKSFVPRSAMVNLTTDLFGHSFNLMEVGVRAENVDHVLESLFGPRGYFKMHSANDVLNEGYDKQVDILQQVKERLRSYRGGKAGKRGKRGVTRDMVAAFDKKVGHSVDHDDHSLDLDFHMKMFGSEVSWMNYHGNLMELMPEKLINKFFDGVDEGVNKAKDFKLDFSPNLAVFDTELVYPTGAGFSLSLQASTHASVNLGVESQVDLPAIFKDPGNAKFRVKLMPSASVQVAGSMKVDALASVYAGLEVLGTLHSSTGVDVDAKLLDNGRGVDILVGVPKDKQEVFHVETQVVSKRRERHHVPVITPVKFDRNRKDFKGYFDQLAPVTGLVVCGELGFPWDGFSSAVAPKGRAMFPLDGPFKASFHVEKQDKSLKNYHFRALVSDKGEHGKAFEVTIDTPGSEVDRTLQLILEGELKPEKYVRVSFKTPWKKFAVEGAVVQSDKEQSLTGKYMSDGDEYKAKLGLLLESATGNKKVYTPSLEIVYPEKKGKVSPKVKAKKPASKGLNLEGTVTIERDESTNKHVYYFDGVNVVTGKGKFGLQGTIARDSKSSYSVDMKLLYSDLSQYYWLKSKCSHHLEPGKWDDVSISTEYEFTSTEIPYLNSFAKWDFVRKPDHMENTLSVNYGPEIGAHINNIHLSNLVLYKLESADNFEISTKNSFTFPKLELDSRLEGSISPSNLQFGVGLKYGQMSGQSEFNLKYGKSPNEGYELKWEVDASGNGFILDSKRVVTSPKTSTVDVCLELKPGGRKYELSSEVTHSYVGPKEFEYAANTVFKIPGHEDYRLDSGMQVHPDNFKYHLEMYTGQVCHFDVDVHGDLSEGWCKKAEWKVLVKDHLEGSGHFNAATRNNQKGDFVVNLLDMHRKVKGEYSWVAVDGKVSLVTDLLWDADKDPSKKLHYEGVIVMPKDTNILDMKNTFVCGDKTTRLNMKATKDGTLTSGVMTGSIDLILHDGRHIFYNGHYKMNLQPSSAGDSDMDLSEVYCDQAPSGSKSCLNFKAVFNHLNVEAGTYNFDGEIGYNGHDGKDVKFVTSGKSVSSDGQRVFEGEGSLGGTLLGDKKLQVNWGGECSEHSRSFHVIGKLGQESLGFRASLDKHPDGEKTTVGEFLIEGHTSLEISQFSLRQKVKITKESPVNFDFLSSTELTWHNDRTLNVKAHVNRHENKGSVSASVCLPGQSEDHGVSVEWNHESGTPRVEGSLAVMWPQAKQIKVELQATYPKDSLAFHLIVHTPFEEHETMEILLNQKKLASQYALETDVAVIIFKDHKTTLHSLVEYPKDKFAVAITMSQQKGPSGKLNLCFEKKGDKHYESELELDWGGEGNYIHAKSSANLEGMEQFALHGYLDSPALKVNKWSIDIGSKQGGGKGGVKGGAGGKRVVFTGKKADEVVFQGSTSFSSKKEGNTLNYEGAGTLKMGGETRNANFKFSLTNHPDVADGVEGRLSMGMTSSSGDKHQFIGEAKLSRKELKLYESYCRADDKCSTIEAYSKVTYEGINHDMNHDFAFIVDLKELIDSYPVSVKGSTHRSVNNNFDHKVEVQFNKGQSKYSYHLYLKEHEAGAYLTLPERTIALVGHFNSEGEGKKEGGLGGVNADVTLWLDKERHPKLKTTGSVLFDASQNGNIYTLMFYGQFAHPSLGKPLAIRGESKVGDEHMWFDSKIEFDVFDKKDQTVVMCVKLHHEPIGNGGHNVTALMDLKSKGQNVDFEWVSHAEYANGAVGVGSFASYLSPTNQRRTVGVLMKATPRDVVIQVKAPTCEIFRLETTVEVSEPHLLVVSEVSLFEQHTHVEKLELKGLNSFKYFTYEKESPDDQFLVHGTLVWGDALQLYVERAKGGQKEVLAHLGVALDKEHLFEMKHTWDQEKIKVYLSDAKNDFNHAVEQARTMSEQMNSEGVADMKALMEMVKKSAPNLKPLLSSYQTQLIEIRDELRKDPVISEIMHTVSFAVNKVTEALSQTIDALTKMFEELHVNWNAFCKEVLNYYEKMMPQINEFVGKVSAVITHELEKWGHYLVDVFERLTHYLGQFSGEFKAFGKVVVKFLQDVARTIGKLFGDLQHHYEEVWKDAMEHLKALPLTDFFAMKLDDVKEIFLLVMNEFLEVYDTLAEMSPTPEVYTFAKSLKKYLLLKMGQEEFDEKAELKNLYELFVPAVKSVVVFLETARKEYVEDFFKSAVTFSWPTGLSLPTSFSYDDIAKLPFFFAARFSPFYLDFDDFPRPSELVQYLWPSLPRGVFPPQNEYGILVGGEHFFTFDGRHYSLSGCACNYILAQDFEDGNFSVAAHLEGGELKSITLMDPKDSVVLNIDNTVLVNGEPANLPVRVNTVSAWTEFDSVSIKSDYGVRVTCDLRFKGLCFVTVNGYYFAKTRGLLGTYNNEPYDDFIIPNGKVAPSVDKLANAWKVDPSCSPVSAQTHDHEHVSQCSEMFAGFSSMRMCFPIVNPAGFREACDANVAMGGGDPCEVAAAYAIACRQEGVYVNVPNKCAQCSIGGSTLDQGHSVSLKAPQGKADVVIVVEQLPENEAVFNDLVVPLTGSLMNDLKNYKITDVKIVLVGFGGHGQKWPSIYTTNGHISFDGKGDNVKFKKVNEEKQGNNKLFEGLPEDLKEYVRRLERMRKLVNVELGLVNYGDTFQLVREYPFRPGAARAVVAVLQSRCLYSPLPMSSQAVRLFFQRKQYEHAGIAFHVITPLDFTAKSKDAKQMKQAVGLDKNSMYTVADGKKKNLVGDSELRKEMGYNKDLCVDFAFATRGAAFSSSNFLELSKPALKKQFMQVVSQRISQSLAPEFTEDCTCKLYHGLHPVTRCWVTSRKERENLKVAAKGVKG